jgi:putative oxidoreductase
MINKLPTDASTQNRTNRDRSRASQIGLWVVQIALAAMFLMAGGSKLVGAPAMVALFDAIGVGQWFRYVTGAIEITSGIALLVPTAAVLGALLLIPTMLGAIITNVFIVHNSPVPPLVLLLGAVAVALMHRGELRRWANRLHG